MKAFPSKFCNVCLGFENSWNSIPLPPKDNNKPASMPTRSQALKLWLTKSPTDWLRGVKQIYWVKFWATSKAKNLFYQANIETTTHRVLGCSQKKIKKNFYTFAERAYSIWNVVAMQWNLKFLFSFEYLQPWRGWCTNANLNIERWIPIWEWFQYIQTANRST